MDNHSNERRRHSRRRKSSKNTVKKNASKISSSVMGIGLVVFGGIMCFYSFGMFESIGSFFQIPDFNSILQLWPIIIVLIGFAFIVKDYFKRSEIQKWD